MKLIFTCDDVAGAAEPARVEQLEMVCEWLESLGIPGTFFWVPRPGGGPASDESDLWMPPVLAARERGHDFQLHAHEHRCLEFGLPQESIRRHAPEMFEEYDADPEAWQRRWEVPKLRAKFEDAIATYERAFGERPLVFRAACLGIGANAYVAMHEAGIRYSSSRSINPAGTGYVMTRRPELWNWDPDYSGEPFEEPPGVLEIPTVEDLVIGGIDAADYDLVLDLFKRDIGHYLDALGDHDYAVLGSHYFAIARDMPLITRLYEELFAWLATRGADEWGTFGEVLE
ncbi:MAG: hypothetical protein GF393_03770 [Armatimonadia bacterium]|nr:hypothetical protein [Armatimonadia bacterium]